MCNAMATLCALIALVPQFSSGTTANADEPLTPKALRLAIEASPKGMDADKLAEQIRTTFEKENLLKGPFPKIDELTVAWAIELPPTGLVEAPRVVTEDGNLITPLTRIGNTFVFAAVTILPEGTAFRWKYEVNRERVGDVRSLEVYAPDPDGVERSDVPKGKVMAMPNWESKVFEGTTRDWWIYIPSQYSPAHPACVMIFQDGGSYRNRVPIVFDNLIAKGEMPVTVGIFIQPGIKSDGSSNRSFEYDTLSNQYARFLLEEILPESENTVKLRHDAESRAIAGISSGGICSFTVAWEKPDEFSKVLSWVGSFTNIASGSTLREGGHNYPALIRKTAKKPIRIFLQAGENDLDNVHGNWPLANQQMAKALSFTGYDYKFVYGHGFHSDRHGMSILSESLRWLWRDYKP